MAECIAGSLSTKGRGTAACLGSTKIFSNSSWTQLNPWSMSGIPAHGIRLELNDL